MNILRCVCVIQNWAEQRPKNGGNNRTGVSETPRADGDEELLYGVHSNNLENVSAVISNLLIR